IPLVHHCPWFYEGFVLVQQRINRGVERQLPLLDQLQDGNCRERLRNARNAEQAFWLDLFTGSNVGIAESASVNQSPPIGDSERRTGGVAFGEVLRKDLVDSLKPLAGGAGLHLAGGFGRIVAGTAEHPSRADGRHLAVAKHLHAVDQYVAHSLGGLRWLCWSGAV